MSNRKLSPLVSTFIFLGHLLRAKGNFVEAMRRLFTARGQKTIHLGFWPLRLCFTSDPAFVHEVLVSRGMEFEKTAWEERVLEPAMKEGLIILQGEEWKRHRHAVAPAFSPRYINRLPALVRDAVHARFALWRSEKGTVREIDASLELRCLINDVIFRYFLNDSSLRATPMSDRAALFARHYKVLEEGLENRVFDSIGLRSKVASLFGAGQQPFETALSEVNASIQKSVDKHRANASAPKCPFHGILSSLKERLGDNEISSEIRSMSAAGLTTVHLMTWLFHLLASHPLSQQKLRAEIFRSLQSLHAGSDAEETELSLPELEELPYLTAVIQEGLRLYPPAPFLMRKRMKKKRILFVSIWAMHRDRDHWYQPDEFIPERWFELGTDKPKLKSFESFLPFGSGSRVCIGKRFAMTEARVLLYEFLKTFELRTLNPVPPVPKVNILTRPSRQIRILLRPLTKQSISDVSAPLPLIREGEARPALQASPFQRQKFPRSKGFQDPAQTAYKLSTKKRPRAQA
jgi:cytochrome P450